MNKTYTEAQLKQDRMIRAFGYGYGSMTMFLIIISSIWGLNLAFIAVWFVFGLAASGIMLEYLERKERK